MQTSHVESTRVVGVVAHTHLMKIEARCKNLRQVIDSSVQNIATKIVAWSLHGELRSWRLGRYWNSNDIGSPRRTRLFVTDTSVSSDEPPRTQRGLLLCSRLSDRRIELVQDTLHGC